MVAKAKPRGCPNALYCEPAFCEWNEQTCKLTFFVSRSCILSRIRSLHAASGVCQIRLIWIDKISQALIKIFDNRCIVFWYEIRKRTPPGVWRTVKIYSGWLTWPSYCLWIPATSTNLPYLSRLKTPVTSRFPRRFLSAPTHVSLDPPSSFSGTSSSDTRWLVWPSIMIAWSISFSPSFTNWRVCICSSMGQTSPFSTTLISRWMIPDILKVTCNDGKESPLDILSPREWVIKRVRILSSRLRLFY